MKLFIYWPEFVTSTFPSTSKETDLQKAYEEDKAFFFRFIDELLFDDDSSFQRRMFRNQGLLGMAMPDDLRDEASFTGGLYANFKEMAYTNARRSAPKYNYFLEWLRRIPPLHINIWCYMQVAWLYTDLHALCDHALCYITPCVTKSRSPKSFINKFCHCRHPFVRQE